MGHIKRLTLVGNTDSSGTDKYNDRLGLHRAQFVKDQLIQRGIPGSMVMVSSDGRRNPLPRRPGETQDQYYARCRRTEIAKIIRKE
jgi:OOP family OmpA-OmpF porin